MSGRFILFCILFCLFGITLTIYYDIASRPIVITQANVLTSIEDAESNIATSTTIIKSLDTVDTRPMYLEITRSCFPSYDDTCAHAYAAPTESSSRRQALRTGMVLLVDETVENELGETWHRIAFAEELRYRERLSLPWYVSDTVVTTFRDDGIINLDADSATTSKRIVVDLTQQMLYAYDAEELFLATTTATGLWATPTPRGHFRVYRKTPTRYMQGPIPGITSQYYDLPGVPWNLYFTNEGAIVHDVYWHNTFGSRYSNGCVNLPTATARLLYEWADIGTLVIVRD